MIPLTPEQREYKEKTLEQLLVNLSLLETKLGQENRPDVADNIRNQLEDIQAHLDHLQRELASNVAGAPIADELFQRAAGALTRKKFYLAKKLINQLETIEPFYPGIERLRQEAEAGRASRRTHAIAQRVRSTSTGETHPLESGQEAVAQSIPPKNDVHPRDGVPGRDGAYQTIAEEQEKRGLAQFFQFHLIVSCLIVLLILCMMFGVGAIMLLERLIEGG
jgi:hypothetical protein